MITATPQKRPAAVRPPTAAREVETPLHREMERQGDWLFRHRSWLPIPLLLALLATAWLSPPSARGSGLPWELFCLAVGGLGLAWRVWIAGHVSSHTSGRNTHGQVARSLNTSGPYSLVRHPLYVGNLLMWLGVALMLRSPTALLATVAFFWFCYERIMVAEERFLKTRFDEMYDAWARLTPAFLPSLRHWRPSSLPFSWRTAARREYSGFFGLVAAMAAIKVADILATGGAIADEPFWVLLVTASALVYVALRTLNRRTRLLRVEGR